MKQSNQENKSSLGQNNTPFIIRFVNESDFAIKQMNKIKNRKDSFALQGKIKQSLLNCFSGLTDLEADFVTTDILINFGCYRANKNFNIDESWRMYYDKVKAYFNPTSDIDFAEWFWGTLAVGKAKMGLPPTNSWRQDLMADDIKVFEKSNAKSNE